jgi:hypothetical protein
MEVPLRDLTLLQHHFTLLRQTPRTKSLVLHEHSLAGTRIAGQHHQWCWVNDPR